MTTMVGRAVGILVLSSLSTGCATFAHGPKERLAIASTPPGAAIFINDEPAGATTPATVSVRRRQHTTVRLEREGYAIQEVKLQRRPSKWLWLNLGLCSNPLAIQGLDSASQWPVAILTCFSTLTAIDLISGAAFRVPRRVDVALTPVQPTP